LYDGVNDPDVGALSNWENRGSAAEATQSLIYEADGALKDGKGLWCASCHDQTETGTAVIDGFEDLLDGWASSGDINPDKSGIVSFWGSESSSGMERGIKGQYLNLWLEWAQSVECTGTAWKNLNPEVNFSNRDTFNFYLKFSDFASYVSVDGILGLKVGLRKAGTENEYSTAQFYINYSGDPAPHIKINNFVDRVWKLVSLPREVFSDPNWGLVDRITFQFFEKACTGDYTVVVHLDEIGCDITGANVWGDSQTRGCSTTGHRHCAWCHDSTREHIDYNRLTIWEYILADSRIEGEYDEHINPTEFRFYDQDDMKLRLALQKYDCDEYANDYGLCYQCHPEDRVRGDIQGQIDLEEPHTNFYNEYGTNLHEGHLPCHMTRLTCVACHDPHGQSSMAMMRDGMGGMVYLDAVEYPCTIQYGADSDGDGTMDWHDPDINKGAAQTRRGGGSTIEQTPYLGVFCVTCHAWPQAPDENDCFTYPYNCSDSSCTQAYYLRDYAYVPHTGEPDIGCMECHRDEGHATHFDTEGRGPGMAESNDGCDCCHEGQAPGLKAGACNNCHSDGGAFDGAQMALGSWDGGVYEEDGTLKPGNENWCLSCHDGDQASSNQDGSGELAPDVAGDNTTYGFNVTGHGRSTAYPLMYFQEDTGTGNPGAGLVCTDCHDATADHVSGGDMDRLKPGYENNQSNENCNQCHPPGTSATAAPQLYSNSSEYEAAEHGAWLCTACHDVHGTVAGAYPAMAADGARPLCLSCHHNNEPNPPSAPSDAPAEHDQTSDAACSICHNPHMPAHGGGEPNCFIGGCHGVKSMHAAHFYGEDGPGLPVDETGCYACHADGEVQCAYAPLFKNVEDPQGPPQYFGETAVCDGCHSAEGS
jgi:predicted CXXCH cytochrome family protein